MRQSVIAKINTGVESDVADCVAPKKLAILIVKFDVVIQAVNGLIHLQEKLQPELAAVREHMLRLAFLIEDPPLKEVRAATQWTILNEHIGGGHFPFVGADDFRGRTSFTHCAPVEPNDTLTEAANLVELMADKNNRAAGTGNVSHLPEAFTLEFDVPDGEDFVHQKNFGLQVRGHCKSQTYKHAAGIMLHRSVNEFVQFGEGHDFIEFAGNFLAAHAQDGAAQISVLPAR